MFKTNLLSISLFMFAIALVIFPDLALAQSNEGKVWNYAGDLACNIASVVESDIARTIASFGIIFMGVGAFLGKLNWGTVLTTALGVFIIFGVAYIVNSFASAGQDDGTNNANCTGANALQSQ